MDREFDNQIKALIFRGEKDRAEWATKEQKQLKEEMATTFGEKQLAEYKHIVDSIVSMDCEKTLKVLLLTETLKNTYKVNINNNEKKTVIKKRIKNKTLVGHLILNDTTIDYIRKNIGKAQSFAKLYFEATEIFKNKTISSSKVNFEGVNTFNKGQWLKFEGYYTNPQNFDNTVNKLKSLVANTPWCTSTLASEQLQEGDFYVFVDNENKPHIAVKMSGDELDELRGIKNGNAQELEEEYRDVAISFLQNNLDIADGKQWLEKEEWNKRLIHYKKLIIDKTLKESEIEDLLFDVYVIKDFKNHQGVNNSNLVDVINILPEIHDQIAKHFNCSIDEILFDDPFSKKQYKMADVEGNYKVFVGSGSYSFNSGEIFRTIESVVGVINTYMSSAIHIKNLRYINGHANFKISSIENFGVLEKIGEDVSFSYTTIKDTGRLKSIGGNAIFDKTSPERFLELKTIGGNAVFFYTGNIDFGILESIGGNVEMLESKVESFGKLKSIGGNLDVGVDCSLKDFGELETIGGEVRLVPKGLQEIFDKHFSKNASGQGYTRIEQERMIKPNLDKGISL